MAGVLGKSWALEKGESLGTSNAGGAIGWAGGADGRGAVGTLAAAGAACAVCLGGMNQKVEPAGLIMREVDPAPARQGDRCELDQERMHGVLLVRLDRRQGRGDSMRQSREQSRKRDLIAAAARVLGIERKTLYRKLERYGSG